MLLGGDSRTGRLKGDSQSVGFRDLEIELLEADDSARVLHENDFIARFLADVFLLPVAKPDGESPSLTDFDETQSFKQRDHLAWLENWERARHYAT